MKSEMLILLLLHMHLLAAALANAACSMCSGIMSALMSLPVRQTALKKANTQVINCSN